MAKIDQNLKIHDLKHLIKGINEKNISKKHGWSISIPDGETSTIPFVNGLNLRYSNLASDETIKADQKTMRLFGQRIVNGEPNLDPLISSFSKPIYPNQVLDVDQGEALFASNDQFNFLMTGGLWPCIAVTVYDPENKEGFLAHLDSPDKAGAIDRVIKTLQENGKLQGGNLEARLIGGAEAIEISPDIAATALKVLENHDIEVVETNLGRHKLRGDAVMLDLDSGEVMNFNFHFKAPSLLKQTSQQGLFTLSRHRFNPALRLGYFTS